MLLLTKWRCCGVGGWVARHGWRLAVVGGWTQGGVSGWFRSFAILRRLSAEVEKLVPVRIAVALMRPADALAYPCGKRYG